METLFEKDEEIAGLIAELESERALREKARPEGAGTLDSPLLADGGAKAEVLPNPYSAVGLGLASIVVDNPVAEAVPCVCEPDMCFGVSEGDDGGTVCAPCSRLDPEEHCLVGDEEEE